MFQISMNSSDMDSDWATLPKHLLDLVIEKLNSSFDYLQFGGVCLQWNSIVNDSQIERNKNSQHHHIPVLLIPNEEHTWSIYNAMDNKLSNSKLYVPYNERLSGSSQGWLITVNKDYTVTLYKPYAMVNEGNNTDFSIHLPCLFPPHLEDDFEPDDTTYFSKDYDEYIKKYLLTADPLMNPNECAVIVIFRDMELAMFRITKDTTWTRINSHDPDIEYNLSYIQDVLQHNNQIYALVSDGVLMSFDVTNSCNPIVKLVAPSIQRRPFDLNYIQRYLVKSCEGELLQVERHLLWRLTGNRGRKTKVFRIFKLDFDGKKWIEIKSLGDHTLFLGDNSSKSVLASNFIGCQPNSIYFTHDLNDVMERDHDICDIGIYHVESRKFDLHFTIDSNVLEKMNRRPPIWIVPTFNYS